MAAPQDAPVSLSAAAGSGSRLTALKALRDSLAADLDVCESMRDKSSLSQRFMDVLAQIDDLGGGVVEKKPETKLDEFTKRLNARQQPAAKGARRPAAGSDVR